jgi:hypothetical protein
MPPKKSELFYNRERYTKFHKVIETEIGSYVCDLMEYQKSTTTKKSIFVFVLQDIYSRMIGLKMMDTKTAVEALEAYKDILHRYFWDIIPHKLTTDGDKCFTSVFGEFLNECNTDHFITKGNSLRDPDVKLGATSIVERTIGSIRRRINRICQPITEEGEVLQQIPLSQQILFRITRDFNTTIHSSLKQEPLQVFAGNEIPTIVLYKHNIPFKNSAPKIFNINDKVRITLQFKKMSENSKRKILNSTSVYKIIARNGHKYLLDKVNVWVKYSRLVLSKDPLTQNPDDDFDAPEVINHAMKLNRDDKVVKYRKQPQGDKALIAYNEVWKNNKNYELPTEKRVRKKPSRIS